MTNDNLHKVIEPVSNEELMNRSILAYNLGKQAFLNEKPCIPWFDVNVHYLLIVPVGQGKTILEAWVKGWTYMNLNNKKVN